MRQSIVLGTGGHCRVVLSMLASLKIYEISRIIELGDFRAGETIMGNPVTPNIIDMSGFCGKPEFDFFLAIGDVQKRKLWWDKLNNLNLSMPNLISLHAVVDETAELGRGNIVCAKSFIGPLAKIGDNNLINTGAIIEHEAVIEDHNHFAPASVTAGRTHISSSCFIGSGATIIENIFISSGVTIGAGAVVVSDIARPNGIFIGMPAKEKVISQ